MTGMEMHDVKNIKNKLKTKFLKKKEKKRKTQQNQD